LHNSCRHSFNLALVIDYNRTRLKATLEKILVKTREELSDFWRKCAALGRDFLFGSIFGVLIFISLWIICTITFLPFRSYTFFVFVIVIIWWKFRWDSGVFRRKADNSWFLFWVILDIRRFNVVIFVFFILNLLLYCDIFGVFLYLRLIVLCISYYTINIVLWYYVCMRSWSHFIEERRFSSFKWIV